MFLYAYIKNVITSCGSTSASTATGPAGPNSSGVGCSGAFVELGVGCREGGCGLRSKQPAGLKAIRLSAVVGCPRPLETPSFLGGLQAMIWISLVSALLGSLSCDIRELESGRKVGEGREEEDRSRTG